MTFFPVWALPAAFSCAVVEVVALVALLTGGDRTSRAVMRRYAAVADEALRIHVVALVAARELEEDYEPGRL